LCAPWWCPLLQANCGAAADGAVTVKNRAAVAAGDLDPLDAVERDCRKIESLEIKILKAPAIDEHQHLRLCKSTEAAQVDGVARAVRRAEQMLNLYADLLRQDVRQVLRRRAFDVLRCDDAGRRADHSAVEARPVDVDRRQGDLSL